MKGDTRCIEGRLWRHDPQHDDPYLETEIGVCPDCDGVGCNEIDKPTLHKARESGSYERFSMPAANHLHPTFGDILDAFNKRLDNRHPKIITNFDYPPIPIRSFDWSAVTDNYDGAPDAGFQPIGRGTTKAEAIADLKRQIADHEDGG